MKTTVAMCAVVVAACTASLLAHHSVSMFELGTPKWIKGTVSQYQVVNPHVLIDVEERTADGRMQRWTVEGPSVHTLTRVGVSRNLLKAGDVIEVCAFPLKAEFEKRREPSDPRFVHAHVLVMPDGHRQIWGPYGKLVNCVRPGDRPQSWVEFVDVDPIARDAWCNSLVFEKVPTLAPAAFVDEVNRQMKDPCR
jgi:hypothetical protein